jgi:hypothetical protein
MSTKQALLNIERNGGKVDGDIVIIQGQLPIPVKYEQSFEGHFPVEKRWLGKTLADEIIFDFEGNGFVLKGENRPAIGDSWTTQSEKYAQVAVYIDGKLNETIQLPVKATVRRHEICWKYQLADTKHTIKLKLLNPDAEMNCYLSELIVYSGKRPK